MAIGYITGLDYGYAFAAENFTDEESEVPVIRIRDVQPGRVQTYAKGEAPHSGAWVDNGDIVIGMDGDFNHVRWRGGRAAMNQRVCALRPYGDAESRYLDYAIGIPLQAINDTVHFTTVKHLSMETLRRQQILFPPIEVQRRVADMLDIETARIDTLIAKNQSVLASLRARVDSLRSDLLWPASAREAWRGSPLDAPTSAVRDATRVQYIVPIRVAGGTPASDNVAYWAEEGTPWFGVGDFSHGKGTTGPSRLVTPAGIAAANLALMQPGDLLLAMYGATSGKAGVLGEAGVTNQAVMAMRGDPRVLRQHYLIEWFIFARPYAYEKAESRSSTQPNLNAGQIEQFTLRCPPLREQDEVVGRLAGVQADADRLTAMIDRQIGLLRFRREALITAAVTGQIDV